MHIFVYKNGGKYEQEVPKTLFSGSTMEQLLDELTRKLDLPRAARRVFIVDGTEVTSMEQLHQLGDKIKVVVSMGENFRAQGRPKTPSGGGRRLSGDFSQTSRPSTAGGQRRSLASAGSLDREDLATSRPSSRRPPTAPSAPQANEPLNSVTPTTQRARVRASSRAGASSNSGATSARSQANTSRDAEVEAPRSIRPRTPTSARGPTQAPDDGTPARRDASRERGRRTPDGRRTPSGERSRPPSRPSPDPELADREAPPPRRTPTRSRAQQSRTPSPGAERGESTRRRTPPGGTRSRATPPPSARPAWDERPRDDALSRSDITDTPRRPQSRGRDHSASDMRSTGAARHASDSGPPDSQRVIDKAQLRSMLHAARAGGGAGEDDRREPQAGGTSGCSSDSSPARGTGSDGGSPVKRRVRQKKVKVPQERTLHFVHLSSGTTPDMLRQVLAQFGEVGEVDTIPRRGIGFVDFAFAESARAAAEAIGRGQLQVDGKRLRLQESKGGSGAPAISSAALTALATKDKGKPFTETQFGAVFRDRLREVFQQRTQEVDDIITRAAVRAWEGIPRVVQELMEEHLVEERSRKQEWMWTVLEQLRGQRMGPECAPEDLKFVEAINAKVEAFLARFRNTTPTGSHLRLRVAVVGPRLSGKSTVLYLFAKSLVYELVANGEWRNTFIFAVNWRHLMDGVSTLEGFYYGVLRHTLTLMAGQRETLSRHRDDLMRFFQNLVKQKWMPRLSDTFEADFKSALGPLRLFATSLQKAWFSSSGYDAFAELAARVPLVFAELFGFDEVQFVYDHFDAADIGLLPSQEMGQAGEAVHVYQYLKPALADHPVLVSGTQSARLYKLLGPHAGGGRGDVLSSLQMFYSYDLVSEKTLLALYPNCDVDLVVEDANGVQHELTLDLLGGCPAYLSHLIDIVEIQGHDYEMDPQNLSVVEEDRRQAYAVKIYKLVRVLTVGAT